MHILSPTIIQKCFLLCILIPGYDANLHFGKENMGNFIFVEWASPDP